MSLRLRLLGVDGHGELQKAAAAMLAEIGLIELGQGLRGGRLADHGLQRGNGVDEGLGLLP